MNSESLQEQALLYTGVAALEPSAKFLGVAIPDGSSFGRISMPARHGF
jgi:hypothetical protein